MKNDVHTVGGLMEACKQRYKTKYVRLPDMLLELDLARTDGTYKKVQAKHIVKTMSPEFVGFIQDAYRSLRYRRK